MLQFEVMFPNEQKNSGKKRPPILLPEMKHLRTRNLKALA
jgi:hypothetical protein